MQKKMVNKKMMLYIQMTLEMFMITEKINKN